MENGLYMSCCYIQTMTRTRRDEETGKKRSKYYVMVALPNGAYNVGLPPDEFDRLSAMEEAGKLKRGMDLLISVEAFGYRDKVYFRAEDDVRVISDEGEVFSGDDASAVSKMEASIKAGAKL